MGFEVGIAEIKTKAFWLALVAEFQATLLFLICVITVCLSWGKNEVSANNVEIGLGVGLAIASLAFAFGHVSGGHINPAVSAGCIVAGRVPLIRGTLYIVVQCVGGKTGSFCFTCQAKLY